MPNGFDLWQGRLICAKKKTYSQEDKNLKEDQQRNIKKSRKAADVIKKITRGIQCRKRWHMCIRISFFTVVLGPFITIDSMKYL